MTRYFKVRDSNELYSALNKLYRDMEGASNEAFALARSLRADNYVKEVDVLAGGIRALHIRGGLEGWHRVFEKTLVDAWFPDDIPENEIVLSDISALPVVKYQSLNGIIGYTVQYQELKDNNISVTDVMVVITKFFLFKLAEFKTPYHPVTHMEEISEAEYNHLKV